MHKALIATLFAAALSPPLPALAADPTRLSMMDDMMQMRDPKGGMQGMQPVPGGMQAPMAPPPGGDPMGTMRGTGRGRMDVTTAGRLPGFPGASHLYHVGATDFFLDHPEHITLTVAQQDALNRLKQRTLLARAAADRRVEDAEQELWMLTAADSPDAAKIEAQVRAIEKLRGDQRMAYIRAVGEAAGILTQDQRAAVLGTRPMGGMGGKPPADPPMPMQHK